MQNAAIKYSATDGARSPSVRSATPFLRHQRGRCRSGAGSTGDLPRPDEGHGAAAGVNGAANDAIIVMVGSTSFSANGNNYFPDLGSQWKEAEFNVFGNCCDRQAVFNSGSSAIVRIEVASGTNPSAPGCNLRSFTGEFNLPCRTPRGAHRRGRFPRSCSPRATPPCLGGGGLQLHGQAGWYHTSNERPLWPLAQFVYFGDCAASLAHLWEQDNVRKCTVLEVSPRARDERWSYSGRAATSTGLRVRRHSSIACIK